MRTNSQQNSYPQTNYGLTVNGKVAPDQIVFITSSATGKTASIASNGQWKLSSIVSAANPAVTSTDLGVTKGTELKDGTADTNTISYNVTYGTDKSRYNFLFFSDTQIPKRFSDVVLTIAQCLNSGDLTMVQYKDLWEERYGLNPGVDEPDSNGNTTKNTNQVQWHRDQNNNIFFSAMFGSERWMVTNLAANTYASNSPIKPALTQTYARNTAPFTAAHYAYPNTGSTTDAGLAAQYNARQRLGRLYNWAAATGNQNPSTANQQNTPHANYQGICPNTWHLPSDFEWTNLMTELIANPTKYSANANGAGTTRTVKDMCEPNANTGVSFGILDGGFNGLLAGHGDGTARVYGLSGFFWSSSSYNISGVAHRRYIANSNNANSPVGDGQANSFYLYSVRCKK